MTNTPLAPFTSLRVGGMAEKLYQPTTYEEAIGLLGHHDRSTPLWFLGFGSNVLISDDGLPGTTIMWCGGEITEQDGLVIADAGVWWDDVVQSAIRRGLWGIELTSEIPGSVGAAVFGNIAAYGQQVSDTLAWVEVYDQNTATTQRIEGSDLTFSYRASSLQETTYIILRAAFRLSPNATHELRYASAVAIASEIDADIDDLTGRRIAIIETRRRAGSIYHPNEPNAQRTAGSFFKNPIVTGDQAIMLASFDESGKTLQRINQQNELHGGDPHRASAAHVLLAAGFRRGQTWENVRLHPDHVLKVETLDGATAQNVADVANEIMTTVKNNLDITIVPEVQFLGKFS